MAWSGSAWIEAKVIRIGLGRRPLLKYRITRKKINAAVADAKMRFR